MKNYLYRIISIVAKDKEVPVVSYGFIDRK